MEDGADKEDVEEDTALGKLGDDDKPGWVMGTISKMLQHHMKSFGQKHVRVEDLTHR